MTRPNAIDTHQASNTVLAAGLARLPQIQEYAGCSIDPVTCHERSPDQAEQPRVFFGSIREWPLEPGVEPVPRDGERMAHRPHVVRISVAVNERVDLPCLPRA